MKSNSADPDFVRMSRFSAAMDLLVTSDQIGDDGRIGLDGGGHAVTRRGTWTFVHEGGDEVVAFEDGLERVPDQGIGFPE